MKKKLLLWIISLICPVIGLILYFIFKKDKEKSKSIIKGSILGLCVYSIVILYFSTHSTNYFDRSVDEWQKDIESGKPVVTVLGASFCQHCQEYKPVIAKIANKNNINLYFYEIDTLPEKDQQRLTTTYNLPDFEDRVPYTFIMKDKTFVASNEGFSNEQSTITFLRENGIIKN